MANALVGGIVVLVDGEIIVDELVGGIVVLVDATEGAAGQPIALRPWPKHTGSAWRPRNVAGT